MDRIEFNLQQWLKNNPNANMTDLCEAIQSADEVYFGWTVQDAEAIREEKYGDRADLSIEDSHLVMTNADSDPDYEEGFSLKNLYSIYADYVVNII